MWIMISGFDRSMFDSQKKSLDCSVCFSLECSFEAAKQPHPPGKRRERKRSPTTCLLTQQVGFLCWIWGGCAGLFCLIGKPEVRGLAEAAGHTQESAWTHLVCCRLSRGREERTGASVSANLVGRWLTSRCPSKCDLGHTFNEIHSTWQAPPLPGPSV